MKPNEFPEARRVLFVNQAESMMLDPQMIPFAMTTAPYTPNTMTGHNPYSKPYIPREYSPVRALPEELSEPIPIGRRFRGYLETLRGRWAGPTPTLRTQPRPIQGGTSVTS